MYLLKIIKLIKIKSRTVKMSGKVNSNGNFEMLSKVIIFFFFHCISEAFIHSKKEKILVKWLCEVMYIKNRILLRLFTGNVYVFFFSTRVVVING